MYFFHDFHLPGGRRLPFRLRAIDRVLRRVVPPGSGGFSNHISFGIGPLTNPYKKRRTMLGYAAPHGTPSLAENYSCRLPCYCITNSAFPSRRHRWTDPSSSPVA